MNDKITLILADDHAMVRKGLTAFLTTAYDIEILAACETGAQLVTLAKQFKPNIILLDLFLPDQPAIETVNQIKLVSAKSQIIIVTSHEGHEYVLPMTKAGAISYILKDISPDDLTDTVRKAAKGESTISPRIARLLVSDVTNSKANKNTETKSHNDLTERELQVLYCISEGLTNIEISSRLSISEKTVKSHVSSILRKLYLSDRTQAAIYAWREGMVK